MFKKILITIFATLIVGAASVSAYNSATTPTTALAQGAEVEVQSTTQDSFVIGQSQSQGQSNGQANEQGIAQGNEQVQQGQAQGQGDGNGYQGGRNETADSTRGNGGGYDSQSVGMEQATLHGIITGTELASLTLTTDAGDILTVPLDSFTLGITLLPGEGVTLGGFWNLDGIFTVGLITLDSTGETYAINSSGGQSGTGNRGGGKGGSGNGGGSGKGK